MRARTKTVTRRLGWRWAVPGMRLMACRKVMGRKKGEPLVKLGVIEIVSVRREPLNAITPEDCVREGFPNLSPIGFCEMFVEAMGCQFGTTITRIEFKHVDEAPAHYSLDAGGIEAQYPRDSW